MKALTPSVICCLVFTACSADPTRPVSLPKDLTALHDVITAASWTRIELKPDPGQVRIVPFAVNNRYQILGFSTDATGQGCVFFQRLGQQRRCLPLNRSVSAMNDFGVFVGTSGNRPAYWEMDQPVSFVPGVLSGSATDVSETGWVIGSGLLPGLGPVVKGFIWRKGWPMPRVLELPDATPIYPTSVNNAGYVAGEAAGRLGVWTPAGEFQRILLPEPVNNAVVSEISDAGQVVGSFQKLGAIANTAGFLWTRGQPLTLMDLNHWRMHFFATDIDRHGLVYGTQVIDGIAYPAVWSNGAFIPGLGFLAWHTRVNDVNDCGVAVRFGPNFDPAFAAAQLWLTEC